MMSRFIRNEGGFFSDYYLAELLQRRHKGKLGESTRRLAWRRLSRRWDRVTRSLGRSSTGAKTRRLWLMPLFAELGYELVAGPSFFEERQREAKISCSHAFQPDSSKPALVYVDLHPWGQDLESPLPGERRRNTPRRKMERILDMGEARWGIVTNGRVIRLLRREQVGAGRRYFEVDLENVFEEEDESSFVVFWALFRAEVFVPDESGECLIDRISEGCQHYAVRVSDELRESVRKALEDFVRGIMEEPANREVLREVDAKELFGQGLIFLYRLLFVLYAESRDLLPIGNPIYRENYSLEALRDLMEDPSARFSSGKYWIQKSLQALFRMIREGVAAGDLMVPAYDGGLFQPDAAPLLESCRVPDSCLATVIETLSVTAPQRRVGRERIAYRELGVEELGAIYEGLLQYEPKIASEEMAVVRTSGSEEIILPLRSVTKETVVEKIPAGTFYLATWGGSRKQSGTYNTPLKITEWLVRQALEPLVEGKSSEEILELNVLDPAMGSGAFLVSACHFLADAYAAALVAEGKEIREHIDEETRAEYRRLVAERCLYGVDLNPLAVELAKVSLWLTTIAKGKPLTFMDQNLVCGDSLIGARLEDLGHYPWAAVGKKAHKTRRRLPPTQLSLYEVGAFDLYLTSLAKSFEALEAIPDETLETIQRKAYLFEEERKAGSFYAKCKHALDFWCSLWFWPDEEKFPNEWQYKEYLKNVFNGSCKLPQNTVKAYHDIAKIVSMERHFLHWELEFPGMFFDENGAKRNRGFDAVVGNPPWEVLMPMTQEFFSRYDPNFRRYDKKRAVEVMENILGDKTVEIEWKKYCKEFELLGNFFRNSGHFVNLEKGVVGVGGVLNTYKLFLEKFCQLSKINGRFSIILPSGIHTDRGTRKLRRYLLSNFAISGLFCFENKLRLFPIHRSFKFVLLSAKKGGTTEEIPSAFMVHDLDKLKEQPLAIPVKLIHRFSPENFSIMECKSQEDVAILNKCFSHPVLGESMKESWNFKLNTREFNMTLERPLFNKEEKGNTLYEGKMIWHFNHLFDSPTYWVETEIGRKERIRKEIKMISSSERSKFLDHLERVNAPVYRMYKKQIDFGNISERNISLHYEDYRIVIRSIASKTNERTLVSTIIPNNNFIGNSLFCVIPRYFDLTCALNRRQHFRDCFKRHRSLSEAIYLCAALNSFIVDYILRQKITTNLNSFFLYEIPIPRLKEGDWFLEQIVPRAARLLCTTEDFSKLWQNVYRSEWNRLSVKDGGTSILQDWHRLTSNWTEKCGVYGLDKTKHDIGDRAQLRCELDALIAHLYGLSRNELKHVLSTFPIVREKYAWVLDRVVEEFERLKNSIDKKILEEIVSAS